MFIGHQAKNVPQNTDLAIFSAAIPKHNSERRRVAKLGIPVKSYAETVGSLTKQYKTVAVAGSHGKSTTTALLSLILIKAGLDPTVIIGTKLKEFGSTSSPQGSNFRNGKEDYFVLEADEYNQSFLNYSPTAAIILNIDAEHLDFYKNLTGVKNAFLKFIKNIQPQGILVLNKDDKNLFSLKTKIQKIAKKNNLKISWYSRRSPIFTRLNHILKIPGEHNVQNALAAYTLAKALKIKDKDIFNAIGRYRGAWRRMEHKGKLEIENCKLKIAVYDDYAHHPTEIKATLSGIARKWPKTGLICVFEPHQAKRLSLLFKEFLGAFDSANALVLMPIYQVAGRDKVSQNVNSKKLANSINRRLLSQPKNIRLNKVIYLSDPKKLLRTINLIGQNLKFKTIIVVMMGAGDIYKLTDKLIK